VSATIFPLSAGVASKPAGGFAQTSGGTAALGAALAPTAAIPVVGPIVAGVAALASVFLAASAKRAAQAKDENSAVAQAVQHIDSSLAQLFQAANAGQISGNDAIGLLNQLWQQYWQICTPHVQPGRNGCNNGALIPAPTGVGCASAYYGCPGNSTANSSWGISCCIGSTIKQSLANCQAAFSATGGGEAKICQLFSSKYGFPGRPAYSLYYTPPAGLASLTTAAAPIESALQNAAVSLGLPQTVGGISTGMIALLVVGVLIVRKVLA